MGCTQERSGQDKEMIFKGAYSQGGAEAWSDFLRCWDGELARIKSRKYERPFFRLSRGGSFADGFSELESRYGELPPSYKDFLAASGGLSISDSLGAYLKFSQDVVRFKDAKIEGADRILSPGIGADDELYFVYSPEQDSVQFRSSYFNEALLISNVASHGFVLINQSVVFSNGETEIIYYGWGYPGAIRFKSFAEFMVYLYFETTRDYLHTTEFYEIAIAGSCAEKIYKAGQEVRLIKPIIK